MKNPIIALAALAASSAAAAPVPIRWTVETSRVAPAAIDAYHGETLRLEASLQSYGRPLAVVGETPYIYWQTNGMGAAYWSAPATCSNNVLRADFTPEMDTGAAVVHGFIGSPGENYRASYTLRFRASPGATPNVLPLPTPTLDFAAVEVLNPPWTDPDYSTSNAALVATIEATAPAPGDYATVSNASVHAAITNALQDTALKSHASQLSQLSQSLDGKADREIVIGQVKGLPGDCFPIAYVYNGDSYSIVNSGGIVVDQFGPAYYRLADSVTGVAVCYFRISDGAYFSNAEASGITFGGTAPTQLAWPVLGDVPKKSSVVYDVDIKMNYYDKAETEAKIVGKQDNLPYPTNAIPYAAISGKPSLASVATSGSYNDLSNKPTIPTVPTAQINAATTTNALQDTAISTLSDSISNLADEVAPAVNGYARLYSFVTGSTNANFVVTNYQLTAEAEAERTHYDPSDPDLDFSTVPPSLRLEDASSGTNRVVVDTRDWTVWYFAQKIGGAMAEAVSTAVNTCRAWCGFTATGLENPVPDTLVVDVPNIWLMAGKTFEKHVAGSNAVWIIRSSGVVMPISDNSQSAGGLLELTDAFGTPYIRFKKTESYFVDPAADGVEYDSATGAWLVAYTTTTCPKGGANAVLEGSTTYPGKAILKDEDDPDCPATITWTGSANNWVMHAVPKQIDGAVPPKMFFAAVVEVQGQDYIEYLRPMSAPSLMFNGATYAPTVNGNKLEFIAQ